MVVVGDVDEVVWIVLWSSIYAWRYVGVVVVVVVPRMPPM